MNAKVLRVITRVCVQNSLGAIGGKLTSEPQSTNDFCQGQSDFSGIWVIFL